MSRDLVIRVVILCIILIIVAIGSAFYIFRPKNTISSVSKETKTTGELEKLPSKTLQEYVDESGFSFQYPEDVSVTKKEVKNDTTYADLLLTTSLQHQKGGIFIKVLDTKFKSPKEWFTENKIATSSTVRDIKIGELSGQEIKGTNRIMAAAIDQNILFSIDVRDYDKYWLEVYDTILSSFTFVQNQSRPVSDNTSPDTFGDDVILEEEIIE